MTTTESLREIAAAIDRRYAICEPLFAAGQMDFAVRELYTEDACYLTGDLRLLIGRAEIAAYFESIKTHIAAVHVIPVRTFGDPETTGIVYQFCNTERRIAGSDEIARAHYVAAFRCVAGKWLMEMEVPSLGWIHPE